MRGRAEGKEGCEGKAYDEQHQRRQSHPQRPIEVLPAPALLREFFHQEGGMPYLLTVKGFEDSGRDQGVK